MKPVNFKGPIAFKDINAVDDLYKRAMRNFDRLEEERYQPQRVFLTEEESLYWPGDTEGRTLLALILLSRATDRKPRYLEQILDKFPQKVNAQGYFGTIHLPEAINEQQLAAHGWVLRALCEHYTWTRESRMVDWIERIINNLAFPTTGFHRRYPIDPLERQHTGSFAGNIVEQIGKWQLSSDIGCDFIFLDGLVHVFEYFPGQKLATLIEEIIERFIQVDLVGIKAQTHATLTGIRALLRYYAMVQQQYLLEEAEKRFKLYKREGMTENYANYNWFRRGEWTEPCAVIDSFIAAVWLWRFTGKAVYLQDAHHIYYNALCHGQRSNGGFGTDTCLGVTSPFIEISVYEAYWCCTMRGGEGLSRAIQYQYFLSNDTLYVCFYHSNEAVIRFGAKRVKLKMHSDYPYHGGVHIQVMESTLDFAPRLNFFKPPNCDRFELRLNQKPLQTEEDQGFLSTALSLRPGDVLYLRFTLRCTRHTTLNSHTIPGYFTHRYGPLILGCESDDQVMAFSPLKKQQTGSLLFATRQDEVMLKPVHDLMRVESQKAKCKQQMLFKRLD